MGRTLSVGLIIPAGPNTAGYRARFAPKQARIDEGWSVAERCAGDRVRLSRRIPAPAGRARSIRRLCPSHNKGHGLKTDLVVDAITPR
jgi:hypothetical protein